MKKGKIYKFIKLEKGIEVWNIMGNRYETLKYGAN
ncbi:MAG: hypothetical protein ACFWTJ_03130 [Lachnoclostridium sp.]|jgi:hypothetical protein